MLDTPRIPCTRAASSLDSLVFLGPRSTARRCVSWICIVVLLAITTGCGGDSTASAPDCDRIDAAASAASRTMAASTEYLAQLMANSGDPEVIDAEAAQYLADVAAYHNALHAWVASSGSCAAPADGREQLGDLMELGRPATEAEFLSMIIDNLNDTEPVKLCAALSAEIGREITCPTSTDLSK